LKLSSRNKSLFLDCGNIDVELSKFQTNEQKFILHKIDDTVGKKNCIYIYTYIYDKGLIQDQGNQGTSKLENHGKFLISLQIGKIREESFSNQNCFMIFII